ncbi:methyl-accepting chemotaxis protein [Parasulfitobacter algicola]|uniref:HAMP domain-containing protein n=1 Tax=Parasulfitobacter algicola TaxID=2614809 RepID=A0ABX2IUV0_9RHOB|nr:methyl-accepting chemotaxis protein [Sulfitobacter algicola]NSX56684.1 HAMP domain-containing protein [Sulfitobacter algicola]
MHSWFKRLSVKQKLLIPLLVAFFIFNVAYTVFWSQRYSSKMQEAFETEALFAETFAAPSLAKAVWDYETAPAEKVLVGLEDMQSFLFAKVYTDGDVFAEHQLEDISDDIWPDRISDLLANEDLFASAIYGDTLLKRVPLLNADGDFVGNYVLGLSKSHIIQQTRAANIMALVIGVFVFCGIGTLVFFSANAVTKPMSLLIADITKLRAGETEFDITTAKRADELGKLGLAIEEFRENMIEKNRLEQEEALARAEQEAMRKQLALEEQQRIEKDKADLIKRQADQEKQRKLEDERREKAEAEQRDRMEVQSTVVGALAEGLSLLAHGDLTCRITESFPGEYDTLRKDFNAAVVQLENSIEAINKNAITVSSTATEISAAINQLSLRTEQQSHSLADTAGSIDELTASTEFTSTSTEKVSKVMKETHDGFVQSNDLITDAVSAMSEIRASSDQISAITSVIDDIAFQTNLLALNAGVEAARAGDAGRGFAVVASEVRGLAQRAGEAAKKIRDLISRSTQQVKTGSDLVTSTGEALKNMVDLVEDATSLVNEVNGSAKQNANSIQTVKVASGNLDIVTQQNAAMAEETSAATQQLVHEAEKLAAALSNFIVSGMAVDNTDIEHKAA